MNYKLPVLFFLFFTTVSSSQNKTYKVNYKYFINGQNLSKSLIFNQKESFFVNTNINEKDKEESEVSQTSDFGISINIKVSFDDIIFKNSKNNNLIFTTKFLFDKNIYKVKDSVPTIKWQLINEFKKNSNFSCQKATTKFRGRGYTVWFCPDIPTNFGPWKFNGLPGLILEVSENTGFLLIELKSIKQVQQSELKLYKTKLNNIKKEITLDEYISKINKMPNEMFSKLSSFLPRGTKVIIDKSKTVANVLELCYRCN